MNPIDIFITSWRRVVMTEKVINSIHERTTPGTFRLHILDNESTPKTRELLNRLQDEGKLDSVLLHKMNTRCLWGKGVFHSMVPTDSKYYIVSDNDVLPPKVEPGWLDQMVQIMDNHPELAFLALQVPPQFLQEPYETQNDIVLCKAVGNTFKMVRREAYPVGLYKQDFNSFGDDGLVSKLVTEMGYKVAFTRNLYCLHMGQTDLWGYEEEDLADDPRKAGYGEPFRYTLVNDETFLPEEKYRM